MCMLIVGNDEFELDPVEVAQVLAAARDKTAYKYLKIIDESLAKIAEKVNGSETYYSVADPFCDPRIVEEHVRQFIEEAREYFAGGGEGGHS